MNNIPIVSPIAKIDNKEKQTLSPLLDKVLTSGDHLFVQKTVMGGMESYLGTVTLEWLATRVLFAAQLPLLHHHLVPENYSVSINSDTIEKIQQRPLDWSRQAALTQYLLTTKHHKFPPVLVVVDQNWVYDPQAPEWGKNERAIRPTTEFLPLDSQGQLGLLKLSSQCQIFALDGQHRLMGVQGLMELMKTGRLPKYKKDKTPLDTFIQLEAIKELYDLDQEKLQSLLQEKIGIEFIPSVVNDENYAEAKKRIRSIFVHINLMAIPLTKGQLAQLDENNGFAIVARNIAVHHPLFKTIGDRSINWDSATISGKSQVFTTLQALTEMAEKYLQYPYPHWQKLQSKGVISPPPLLEELTKAIAAFAQLFDALSSLPSYKNLTPEIIPQLRRFSWEKNGGKGNLLFRPVGQIALIHAIAIMRFKQGVSLEIIFEQLQKYDLAGGFSHIEAPQSLFYGILYDSNQSRILVSGKDLATKILVYLLGGITDSMEKAELRRKVAEARTIQTQAIGFDGKFVDPKKVGLPPIL